MGKGLSYRAPMTRKGCGCDSKGHGGHWKVLVGLGGVGVMGCQG